MLNPNFSTMKHWSLKKKIPWVKVPWNTNFKSCINALRSLNLPGGTSLTGQKYTHPGRYSISTYDDIVLEDSNISSGNRVQSEKIAKFNIL